MIQTTVHIIAKDSPPIAKFVGKKVLNGRLTDFSILEAGMQSGRTSVAFFVELDNGQVVFVETSGVIFEGLAAALKGAKARFGDTSGTTPAPTDGKN